MPIRQHRLLEQKHFSIVCLVIHWRDLRILFALIAALGTMWNQYANLSVSLLPFLYKFIFFWLIDFEYLRGYWRVLSIHYQNLNNASPLSSHIHKVQYKKPYENKIISRTVSIDVRL